MYGYIKPYFPELKGRDATLYRAYYCGLCRQMGKVTGQISRMSLSYDMTFFALVRSVAFSENISARISRCAVRPMKKRLILNPTEQTEFAACASAVFMREKLTDSVNDDGFLKKTASAMLIPFADNMKNRSEKLCGGLYEAVCDDLSHLTALEKAKCDSLDDASSAFGDCLGRILSWGSDGSISRILFSVGKAVGKFVYIIDACDDCASDIKSGSYNPICEAYGKDICEVREVYDLSGKRKTKEILRRDIAENIMLSSNILLTGLMSSAELLRLDSHRAGEIVRNIITLGMPAEMKKVLGILPKPTDEISAYTDYPRYANGNEEGSRHFTEPDR